MLASSDSGGFGDAEAINNFALPSGGGYFIHVFANSSSLMQLYEQGAFILEDPVAAFLPEFADMEVLVGGNLTQPRTRPAQTTMTAL